jgi:hypothetical protein
MELTMTLLDLYEDEPPLLPFNEVEFWEAVRTGGKELQEFIRTHRAEEGK